MPKYLEEYNFISKIIKEVYLESQKLSKEREYKNKKEIVTATDFFIEKILIAAINKQYPNDTILSEEFYANETLKERTWTIDPIDGTSNYSFGMPLYCVQCALIVNNEIVMSYIFVPNLNKEYYAIKNYGAFCNNERLIINDEDEYISLVSLVGIFNETQNRGKVIEFTKENNLKIRNLGSAGIELAFASNGYYNLFVSNISNPWDIAPGLLLVKEAGLIVENNIGENYQLYDDYLVIYKNENVRNRLKTNLLVLLKSL